MLVLVGALERRLESANGDAEALELSYVDWLGYVGAVLVATGWYECPPSSSSSTTTSPSSMSASGRVNGMSRGGDVRFPERQSMISKIKDASQKPNANQKNIAPAFFVLHQPGRAFVNASPRLA